MDFSKLSQNDKMALGAGAVVAITGLISVANNWGIFMVLSLLAGLLAVFVIVQPQVAPATRLPATKGVLLLAAGGIAVIASGLTAIDWMGWILEHIASFDTLQFVIGLIAAIVLAWIGWTAYNAERGKAPAAAATPPPAAS
jgi:hypothetical protein